MNRRTMTAVGGVVALVAVIAIAIVAAFVLREPEEASAPIEAIPLELEATDEVEPTAEPEPTDLPTEMPTEAAESGNDSTAEEPTAEPEPTEAPTEEPTPEPESLVVFTIQQEGSQVRFEIDEDLRGVPTTVIGVTDQVAGQIAVAFSNPETAQVGIIQINARTLVTDNDFRNRAINNEILETDTFEFITFEPTEINSLPDNIAIGEAVTFDLIGDLTVRDITHTVTFTLTVTVVSETELSGTATTVITREMFGISIPSVPGVANVEEEIELFIDFIATSN